MGFVKSMLIVSLGSAMLLTGCSFTNKGAKAQTAMFMGNLQHTGVYNTKGIEKLTGLKWKFKTEGRIRGSAVLFENSIYFGSDDCQFYSVDMSNGKENWRYKADAAISSTAAVNNSTVYFTSDGGCLYALDTKTGSIKWKYETKGEDSLSPQDQYDYYNSSPVVLEGTVCFGSRNGYLYALDAAGKLKWKFDLIQRKDSAFTMNTLTVNSPAVYKNTVYAGSFGGTLYALDFNTGKEKWRFETNASIQGSPSIAGDIVYFGGRDTFIHALDVNTGKEKWSFKSPLGSWFVSTPSIDKGILYSGSSDDKKLYTFDAKTGEPRWEFAAENRLQSSPALNGNMVYIGSEDKRLYALDVATGKEKWRFETEDAIFSSPVISEGVVYVGSDDGFMYALE